MRTLTIVLFLFASCILWLAPPANAQAPYFPFEAEVTSEGNVASFSGSALAHVLIDEDDHLLELQLSAEAGEVTLLISLLTKQRTLAPGTYDAAAPLGDIETIEDGFRDLPEDGFVTLAGFSTNPSTTRLSVEEGTLTIYSVTPLTEVDDLPADLSAEDLQDGPLTHLIEGEVNYRMKTPGGTEYRISGSFKALETVQEAADGDAPVDSHHHHHGHSH